MEFENEDNWEDFPVIYSNEIKINKQNDVRFPYYANYDGKIIKIRINNFPEDPLFTLFVDGIPIINFNNWPPNWKRD